MSRVMLTVDMLPQLLELVYYKDGEVINRITGRSYGSYCVNGYVGCTIKLNNTALVRCYLHRLIFLLNTGTLPKYIDHIDGNKHNNNIVNLRAVTQSVNGHNCKLSRNNKSGINGVYYDKNRSKWCVCIKIDYKKVGFKRFDTKTEAISYRKYLEEEYKDVINKPQVAQQ